MRVEKFETKLREYIDAQMPIIYIDSFDDNKIDEMILKVTGSRKIWEWNELEGCVNRKKTEQGKPVSIHETISGQKSLYDLIRDGACHGELDRKILIVKDVHPYLEEPKLVALLKKCLLENRERGTRNHIYFYFPHCQGSKGIREIHGTSAGRFSGGGSHTGSYL